MKVLDVIVTVLLLAGGLNWGLMGFFGFNLIAMLFGEATAITRVFYALVGLSALYEIGGFAFGYKAIQERWCETIGVKH